jgi:hypothetical protein
MPVGTNGTTREYATPVFCYATATHEPSRERATFAHGVTVLAANAFDLTVRFGPSPSQMPPSREQTFPKVGGLCVPRAEVVYLSAHTNEKRPGQGD